MGVSKSSSRKKQDRARAAAKRAEQERLRAKAARERESAEHFSQLSDPSTSPADIAAVLAAELPDRVIAAEMMKIRLALGVPAEDVTKTAQLLLERAAPEPPGIGALAVAALAAHLAGDEEAEHGYARELLARADASRHPEQWLEVIRSATDRDHPGETCELIEPYLREHPEDELAGGVYAYALTKAYAEAEPGELETAALDRYRDRSSVDALDRAVGEFTERTPWGAIIRTWLDGERAGLNNKRWGAAERDTTDALMAEVAIVFPYTSEAVDPGDDDYSEPDTPLRAFAADEETPAELAARATERDEHVRYGVWQVADPSPAPGVWCIDLVSGMDHYVQFAPEVIDDALPWSVWLGALAPAEGIWRASRTGVWLSPVEGDAIAEYMDSAVWDMLSAITGERDDYSPPLEQVRFGMADPYGVRWETGEEPEPEAGDFVSAVAARLAPRLSGWVWQKRTEGMELTNTDGEPMVLINAAVAVDGDVTERLFARADFGEEEDHEDGQVVWWGEPVYEVEERTVLARLMPAPGRVQIRVNSQRRLKRLLQILREIGAAPKVVEESRSEPSVDFAWGPVPADGTTARQWAENWLDQPVAVLEFHTPRHAAQGDQPALLRLEGLLRQLEYQSALPAQRGGRPVDTAWLRAELGLENDLPLR
jgi:hypothetical protein